MRKILLNLFVAIISSSALAVSAGPIEVDIFGDGSNKGFSLDIAGYGLEWMDFEVNNKTTTTYGEVLAELGVGGRYEGWRQPTADEVIFLWSELFLGLHDTLIEDSTPDGYFFLTNDSLAGPSLATDPDLLALTEITGFRSEVSPYSGTLHHQLIGYFPDPFGEVDQIVADLPFTLDGASERLVVSVDDVNFKWLSSWMGWGDFEDLPLASYSVMLVRDAALPLPPSWGLGLLAVCGVAMLRRRKLAALVGD